MVCKRIRLMKRDDLNDVPERATLVADIPYPDGDWIEAIESYIGHPLPRGKYRFEIGMEVTKFEWTKSLSMVVGEEKTQEAKP